MIVPFYCNLTLEDRRTLWRINKAAADDGSFVDETVNYFRDHPEWFRGRLHLTGDFYSVEYVEKWIRVMERLQSVDHVQYVWTTTRSWRAPEIEDALLRLVSMRKFVLTLSLDKESGKPSQRWASCRWFYVSEGPNDRPDFKCFAVSSMKDCAR